MVCNHQTCLRGFINIYLVFDTIIEFFLFNVMKKKREKGFQQNLFKKCLSTLYIQYT